MSKYKKQFIIITEEWLSDNPNIEILDIRDTYNPDFNEKLNRTYAHIKINGEEGLMVFDWNDKFEITNRDFYPKNNKWKNYGEWKSFTLKK